MAFPIQQGLFQFVDIDYYAILGVPIGAELKEVRLRYLTIARRLHPDTCKASTNAEKERASNLLSKLINPAWENLSREQARMEFRVILSQVAKGLSQDKDKITLNTEAAQKLMKTKGNIDLTYISLVKSLAKDQYTSLDNIYQKIAQLSELNLAYLVLTQGSVLASSHTPPSVPQTPVVQSTPIIVSPPTPPMSEPKPESKSEAKTSDKPSIESYIRRGKECLDNGNYAQAVQELRDALRIEPNNSSCHALLGLAYLKQKQMSMAKVHINTALKYNPSDPEAIEAKKELDKSLPPDKSKKQSSSKPSKDGGGFWSIFGGGGKKK